MSPAPNIQPVLVERLRGMLAERFGYEIPADFGAFIARQSARLASELGFDSVLELARALDQATVNESIWIRFISRMTIGESYLFRNSNHMRILRKSILPALVRTARKRPVYIWSAGCSRGEEPYTLAILLHELAPNAAELPVRIVATDIDAEAIDSARRFTFGKWAFRQTPYAIQKKYFAKEKDRLVLHPTVASMVAFGYHHVSTGPDLPVFPREGFDLILCRNLLMYLRMDYREMAGRGFARRLHKDGFAIPGQVERFDGVDGLFERTYCGGSAIYHHLDSPEATRRIVGDCQSQQDRRIQRRKKTTLSLSGLTRTLSDDSRPGVLGDSDKPTSRATSGSSSRGRDVELEAAGERLSAPTARMATTPPSSADERGPQVPPAQSDAEHSAEAHLQALTGAGLYDSVRTLMHDGHTDDAVDHCMAIIEAEPLEAEHHCLLALVFLESEHPDAAITSLRRAIYCDPDNLTAFYMWWLIGVRYRTVNAGRANWARLHLHRLVAGRTDEDVVPLFGRVTIGDVRYMLQCEWSALER